MLYSFDEMLRSFKVMFHSFDEMFCSFEVMLRFIYEMQYCSAGKE
jgi:hypothetical protein